MRLCIVHRTVFRYALPARQSFNEARLQPIENARQRLLSYDLHTSPHAARHDYHDLYGNAVSVLELVEPHAELVIEAGSVVETVSRPTPDDEDIGELAHAPLVAHLHDFLMDTAYVEVTPELWRCAVDCLPGGVRGLWAGASALSDWVHGAFLYEPGATNAHSTVSETLADRRGVCQDFAHVLLGLCRALKIPARYVSGYFFDDTPDLAFPAEEASHAWVEIFLPHQGWHGLDPTHRRPVDERYVCVAVGRDYGDIRPVSGTYRGADQRSMDVYVKVTREDLQCA